LAGCRSGKELAQGDEVGVLLILQPSAPLDRFGTEIPQMRDRATEGGDTELEEDPEYFPGGTARPGRRNYRVSHSRVPSRWVSRRFRERPPLTSTGGIWTPAGDEASARAYPVGRCPPPDPTSRVRLSRHRRRHLAVHASRAPPGFRH